MLIFVFLFSFLSDDNSIKTNLNTFRTDSCNLSDAVKPEYRRESILLTREFLNLTSDHVKDKHGHIRLIFILKYQQEKLVIDRLRISGTNDLIIQEERYSKACKDLFQKLLPQYLQWIHLDQIEPNCRSIIYMTTIRYCR